MKALAKIKEEAGIWMIDAPVPECGHNDLLIKINKTAICGTDIHIFHWDKWSQRTVPVPMIIGHEFAGEVAAMGIEVSGFKIGDRVSGEGHITCGCCRNCRAGRRHLCRQTSGVGVNRQGCFAEYLVIPASNAFKLKDTISDEEASIFDPFGNAAHTALSFDLVGEDVLITGAGPIGIMAGAIAKHAGARNVVITDVNEYRLGLAQKLGVTKAVNVARESLEDAMVELGMEEGFDVGMEMSGNPAAQKQLFEVMNNGGKVAMLGIPPGGEDDEDEASGQVFNSLGSAMNSHGKKSKFGSVSSSAHGTPVDWNQIIFKGLTLKGIYGREMYETWYKMAAMVDSGLDIKPIITHRYAIDDFQDAFETMASVKSGKVILEWT